MISAEFASDLKTPKGRAQHKWLGRTPNVRRFGGRKRCKGPRGGIVILATGQRGRAGLGSPRRGAESRVCRGAGSRVGRGGGRGRCQWAGGGQWGSLGPQRPVQRQPLRARHSAELRVELRHVAPQQRVAAAPGRALGERARTIENVILKKVRNRTADIFGMSSDPQIFHFLSLIFCR